MIIVDIREPDFVVKEFRKMGIPVKEEEIAVFLDNEEEKVGDFTNYERAVIIERKRVDDFYKSMIDGRLYKQLKTIDSCFEKQKYLILEGYNDLKYYQDSLFDEFDKGNRELDTKSPIQQVIEMHPHRPEWVWGQVKLAAQFNVALLQTYDLKETVLMVEQLCKGAGQEPSLRFTKKRYKSLPLERQILMLFPQIGKKRSKQIIDEFGSLSALITEVRNSDNPELDKYKIYKKIKEVFK